MDISCTSQNSYRSRYPVLIGTALAAMDGHFHWLPALICCLFASLMQIAANFINDLSTSSKGQIGKIAWDPNVLVHRDGFLRKR